MIIELLIFTAGVCAFIAGSALLCAGIYALRTRR